MTQTVVTRRFAGGMSDEPRHMLILRRIFVPLVAVQVALGLWSGYRAIVQIFSLQVHVDAPVLHAGSTVQFDVVTSGRAWATVTVELVQGARAETLSVTPVPGTRTAVLDPRTRSASRAIAVAPEVLAHFASGPAIVRVTALGRPQWMRTPPPTVRESMVTISQ